MTCLENIIKLSRTECECFDEGKPTDYNEGKSEVYLDELQGLTLSGLQGSESCEAGGLWDMMARSRENAVLQFRSDLMAAIQMNYTSKRPNYSGTIGDLAFNSTLNLTEDKAGLVIRPYQIVGGYMTINRLALMFNVTAPITIKVYNNEDYTTEIASYNVNSAANTVQYVALSVPLKLPLWSTSVSTLEYYIVYDLTGAYLPKNNKLDCGCGKSVSVTWKNWISMHGIKGSSSSTFNTYATTKELNGLAVDATFSCESGRLICSEEYPLDFSGNDGRAMQIAYAVRFKAGEMLVQKILDSDAINRYTLMNREALYGKRAHYQKKYEEWILYLVENTEILNTDCLICRPNPNFVKGTIFS